MHTTKKNNKTPQQTGQDNSLSVGPLTCRNTWKRNRWPIGKKKGTPLQNKQTPPNFETIKRLIKQKHKKNSPRKPLPHPARHIGKTSNPHGKTTKINPENKQLQISSSTQVTTVSQHTSITSKSSAITTAQYANWRIQQWTKITFLCAQNWTIPLKNYQNCTGMPED